MNKILDAVSAVLIFQDELFIIKRQKYLKAFPGYWAFPGGKVEDSDDIFYFSHPMTKGIEPKLFGALAREIKEELGIDLVKEMDDGRIEEIDLLGLAITPDFNPLRFSTYFYKIEFSSKPKLIIDQNEAELAHWVNAQELLAQYNKGQILAVPPVIKVIENLGKNPKTKNIDDLNFRYDSTKSVPYIESIKSVRQIMPLSHTLPPATRTNAFLIGDKGPKLLIDPSPKDDQEYQKFIYCVKGFGVDKILLTHHHPDHHEQSTRISREFKIPMLMSQDTHDRLLKLDQDYFNDIKVEFVKEGDVVTDWLGEEVSIYEVPGHDEGQVALAPKSLAWFLAGDLFQGVGTVVIGGNEGNMQKYFHTLEKVIQLNPSVLYPSHGIALGGVVILEKTLEHRRVRENQVLVMHKQGLTEQQMLEEIYKDVDKKLWPYALENIKKHLEKLLEDEKI